MIDRLHLSRGFLLLAGALAVVLAIWFAGYYATSVNCTPNRASVELALDRSRAGIEQQSGAPAPQRCAAYRSHIDLLETKRKCVGGRELPAVESEVDAYKRLAETACS